MSMSGDASITSRILGGKPTIADRHLPQRLDGEVIAHRMREDRDRSDIRIVRQRLQHRLQRVARIHRAVAIVDIVDGVSAGGPGEQHRRDVDPRVVDDLGEAVDRFLEAGVVAVHEYEHLAPRRARHPGVEVGFRLGARSRRSARRVTKSREGSPGAWEGHWTSPALRALSGGTETTISANCRPFAAGAAEHDARAGRRRGRGWWRPGGRPCWRRARSSRRPGRHRACSSSRRPASPTRPRRRTDKRGRCAALLFAAASARDSPRRQPSACNCRFPLRLAIQAVAAERIRSGAGSMPCFGRFGRLLSLAHEPPDRRENDHDQQNDRPHREPAGTRSRRRRAGGGAGRRAGRGRARSTRPNSPSWSLRRRGRRDRRADRSRRAPWTVRPAAPPAIAVLLAAEHRGDRGRVRPVGRVLLADRADRRLRRRRRSSTGPRLAERRRIGSSAPTMLERPEPPSRPPSILAPSVSERTLPPLIAPESFVRRSGSEFETASTTFWAPPGAAAVVASAPRIIGIAAATSFCATASLMPTARARPPTSCGVRNWDTKPTRSSAIGRPSGRSGKRRVLHQISVNHAPRPPRSPRRGAANLAVHDGES